MRAVRTGLVALLILGLAGAAMAQFGRGFGRLRYPERPPRPESFGNGFNFCRGIYTQVRGEPGGQAFR